MMHALRTNSDLGGATMGDFVSEILRLDDAGDYAALIAYFNENLPEPKTLIYTVYRCMIDGRFRTAQVLAGPLIAAGADHPVVHFAQSIGGFLYGNESDEREGAVRLAQAIDLLSPEKQSTLCQGVFQRVFDRVVRADAALITDANRALRLLKIIKAAVPMFRTIFEWEDAGSNVTAATLAQQGRARATLISLEQPPPGAPRPRRRVIYAGRERVFPQDPSSRLYETGPKMSTSMAAYGWDATFLPTMSIHFPEDFANIVAVCEQEKPDLLIFDDLYITVPQMLPARAAMIEALREKLPSMKIASLHQDPWEISPQTLIETSVRLDAVMAQFPSMPVWQDPAFKGKMIFAPIPHAGTSGPVKTPMSSRMKFIGGVFGYNWHRIFWLAGAKLGLPIDFIRSTHRNDGLSVIDSYDAYMRRTEAAGCVINFSMRSDLSRVMTGRNLEGILSGALLVAEETPDMDYYFVAGEHYLSFATVPELRALARFIAEKPEEAEAIRRRGNEFGRERYSDEKLVGHIDYHFFYRQ